MAAVILLLYPLLVHMAVLTGMASLQFCALVVLAANVLGPWLRHGRGLAWAGLIVAAVVALGLAIGGSAQFFLYLAPVLVATAMAWFFARTLLPGREPLITRFARLIRRSLPDPVARYTRGVTLVWSFAMLVLALANALLAILASPVVWSLFTNFIDYLLIACLFVGEWFVRRWLIGDYERLNWLEYLTALRKIDYRRIIADD